MNLNLIDDNLDGYMKHFAFRPINRDIVRRLHATASTDTLISRIMRLKLESMFINRMMFVHEKDRKQSSAPQSHPQSDLMAQNWEDQLGVILRYAWICGFGACVTDKEARRIRTIQTIAQTCDTKEELWRKLQSKWTIKTTHRTMNTAFVDDSVRPSTDVGAEPEDDENVWFDRTRSPQIPTEDSLLRIEAVDLNSVAVYCKRDSTGPCRYLYWVRAPLNNSQGVFIRLKNVFTFVDEMPLPTGEIVSRVSRLQEDYELEHKNRESYMISMATRAAPYVPIEQIDIHDDDDTDRSDGRTLLADNQLPAPRLSLDRSAVDDEDYYKGVEAAETLAVTEERSLKPITLNEHTSVPTQAYLVPKGTKVGKQSDANDPTFFVECLQMRHSRIFGEFDLPESVIGLYSLQESKGYSSIGGLGGKTLSINSLPWKLFVDSAERLTSKVTRYINSVMGYATIQSTVAKLALQLVENEKKDDNGEQLKARIDEQDVDARTVKVMMPKRQMPDLIISLMSSGVLRYEVGVNLLAESSGLDVSCFSPFKPEGLAQLVGIKPEEPAKKKAKKK